MLLFQLLFGDPSNDMCSANVLGRVHQLKGLFCLSFGY